MDSEVVAAFQVVTFVFVGKKLSPLWLAGKVQVSSMAEFDVTVR